MRRPKAEIFETFRTKLQSLVWSRHDGGFENLMTSGAHSLFALSRTRLKSTLPIQEELYCRTGLGILVHWFHTKRFFCQGEGKGSTLLDGVIHLLIFYKL